MFDVQMEINHVKEDYKYGVTSDYDTKMFDCRIYKMNVNRDIPKG